MSKTIWLVAKFLITDFKFLRLKKLTLSQKIKFLMVRNWLLIKHLFIKKFEFGRDRATVFGEQIYYASPLGIMPYQTMLITHQTLLETARIADAKVVLDVGAQVGYFSKLVRRLYPDCLIYGFEPVPAIFNCLVANFKDDSKIKLFQRAVTDQVGTVKMLFSRGDLAISAINPQGDIEVSANTLDRLVEENRLTSIDIIKIDVESFEAHVLRGGARRALALTKYVMLEFTTFHHHNYTLSSLMKLLNGDTYDFQIVAFKNYENKKEGEEGQVSLMDIIFKNIKLV
ncbi:MAG: FkbM family methyltransferase [Patescibacteria group bacterium]|jgi:FkbM family methyltransferase